MVAQSGEGVAAKLKACTLSFDYEWGLGWVI